MESRSIDLLAMLPIQATQPAAAATQPMEFGVPLDHWSPLFFGCLIAAIAYVFLFCRQKFNERSTEPGDDFVYQLLPRQLATHQEYTTGFMTYFGAMAATVVLLSLIGPKNLGAIGIPLPKEIGDKAGYAIVPIAIAFILVGVMPMVPGLLVIERMVRKFAHERAYIPAAAKALAERLAAADFEFSIYAKEALQAADMDGVEKSDFDRPRRSLEHNWARLSCLVHALRSRRQSGDFGGLAAELLRAYEKDLQSIEDKRDAMKDDVAAYRTERRRNKAYENAALHAEIRGCLYKLYILIACAVRMQKQPYTDIDPRLRALGFSLTDATAQPSNADLLLVGIVVVTVAVALIEFTAVVLGNFDLWTRSALFPRQWYQPFVDTTSILVPHVAAILVADLMRRRMMKRGSWAAAADGSRLAIAACQLRVAIACGIAGFVASVLWGRVFGEFTITGALIVAPFALPAMVTGGFYAYHLDNVAMQRRPSRPAEIGWQGLATGTVGFMAASVSFNLLLGHAALAMDNIAVASAASVTIGAVLGLCIPDAASAAGTHPLDGARAERMRALRAEAQKCFGDAARADAWLEQPCRELGNKRPRDAAADIHGFEYAVSLLRELPAT